MIFYAAGPAVNMDTDNGAKDLASLLSRMPVKQSTILAATERALPAKTVYASQGSRRTSRRFCERADRGMPWMF